MLGRKAPVARQDVCSQEVMTRRGGTWSWTEKKAERSAAAESTADDAPYLLVDGLVGPQTERQCGQVYEDVMLSKGFHEFREAMSSFLSNKHK